MSCTDCGKNPKVDCKKYVPSHCVTYTGPNLTNLGLTTNLRLDEILQKINDVVSGGGFTLFTDDTSTIDLSGNGTASSHLKANLLVGNYDNSITDVLIWTGSSVKKTSISTIGDTLLTYNSFTGAIYDGVGALFQDTSTVDFTYDSTTSAITGDVLLSTTPNNAILAFSDGLWTANTIKAGVVYGGIVTWSGTGYTYNISAAGYYINGVFFTSPAGVVTLDGADVVYDRIDTFVVDNQGQTLVLKGTPSDNPAQAPLDPATQLQLSFSLVQAGSTQPGDLEIECIYKENTEWSSLSSNTSRINPDSTTSPSAGAKAIEGVNTTNGDNIVFTRSAPLNPTLLHTLINLKLKPVTGWLTGGNPSRKNVSLQFQNTSGNVGSSITVYHGKFGFDASVPSYQAISISLSDFGLTSASQVTKLKLTTNITGGGTLSYHIDDICLQGMPLPSTPTSADEKVKISAPDTTTGYLEDKLIAGSGITLSKINAGGNESLTVAHADTSSVSNLDTTGAQVIDQVSFDGFGHVQGITTRNLTLSDIGYTPVPYPVSIGFTGTTTKTLTLTLSDSSTIVASFTDLTASGGTGLSNAYVSLTDGTNTASANGSDIIKFRSGNSFLDVLVGDNNVTHGDNVLYTVNTSVLTEFIQDTAATALTDSSSIDFTYNDTAGTITATVVDSYIRNLFSGGTGITYNSTTGLISSSVIDTNFAKNNLTFTGSRSHNLDSNSLTLTDGSQYQFDTITTSGASGQLILSPSSGQFITNYLGGTEYAKITHNHNSVKPWVELTAHNVSTDNKIYVGTDEVVLSPSNSSVPVRIPNLPVNSTLYTVYYNNTTGKLSYDVASAGSEAAAYIEVRFKVGVGDAPVSGDDTTFTLTDCSGNPLTGKRISFYLERYRLYPEDDYTYDPVTAEIVMGIPFSPNQRVLIECYPAEHWTACNLGTSSSSFPYGFPISF